MPNQPACTPCKYPEVERYLDRRLSEGANLKTIRSELASPYRKKTFGIKREPTQAMLAEHQRLHRAVAPVSGNLPSFEGDTDTAVSTPQGSGDVAGAIQREALAALERGEMRITATNALKAQEMLDRRAEKAADRELTLVLARLLTQQAQAPDRLLIEDGTIEGDAEEIDLGTADD